jgi:2-oxoglutarate ferredoxin oxidoreductase subunit alpha
VTIINVQRGGPSTGMPTRTQQSDLLSCAYASHGDTKHVLLLPEDPHECFEHSAQAFDLADRLQTPVFVMTDLDIGMNQRLCKPLAWDDTAAYDRGKVLTRRGARGRQGLRPLQGRRRRRHSLPHLSRHAPDQGRYFTRGTTKRPYAATARRRRLHRQHAAAAAQVRDGAHARAATVLRAPQAHALRRDLLRLHQPGDGRGAGAAGSRRPSISTPASCAPSPSPTRWSDFIAARRGFRGRAEPRRADALDAGQRASSIDPKRAWFRILHYDGTPITARFIVAGHRADRQRRVSKRFSPEAARRRPHDLHRQTQDCITRRCTKNKVGYTRRDYEGRISTLCAGCGHDSISAAIIQACWELDIEPHRVAKLSGIGCSSKTPDYFLGPATASTPCTAACPRC